MFKFSFEWLKSYCDKNITPEEVFKILNLQGFEFQGKEKIGSDIITAIEVKANRPDMLSHIGIAREINAYQNKSLPLIPKALAKNDNKKFPIKINISDEKTCKRFCALLIKNVNNKVKTPEYVKNRLEALGINHVNPVVDILNYVMLDMGQPMHSYDIDKISNSELNVKKAPSNFKIKALGDTEEEIREGDIIISDKEKTLCVAGIIGTDAATVTSESKDIMLEAAVFNEVSVRLTSRALKISTPSSFRFERGVNAESSMDILYYCAKTIKEICGGEISSEQFNYYSENQKNNSIKLSLKNTNSLLGTSLNIEEIKTYLEKYGFACTELPDDALEVNVPSYRLDVKKEVDLIEEVARIHGYDNIPIEMPTIRTSYNKNSIWTAMDHIRSILIGMNFSETINYSFIPNNTMELLGIKDNDSIYSNILLQNPISNAYSLMRPTLVYSLINCLAYNYSVRNTDLAIFELGRTYFKDKPIDTGCKERNTCGIIMSGTRIPKGWGCDKEVKYSYYDLLSYLEVIMDYFGLEFELENIDYRFCENGSACEILSSGERIGFIGELNKKCFGFVKNVKLIKDKIFYCEFYIDKVGFKSKKLRFESKYPPVKRLYNLVHSKNVRAKEIEETIKNSSENVREVKVKDIYSDKNMSPSEHAVLYEVNYCSKLNTLTLEEIKNIENNFLKALNNKFNASLKS